MRSRRALAGWVVCATAIALVAGCRERQAGRDAGAGRQRRCPAEEAIAEVPDVPAGMHEASFWERRMPAAEADRVLLDAPAIAAANARILGLTEGRTDLAAPDVVDPEAFRAAHQKRFADLRAWVEAGKLAPVEPAAFARAEATALGAHPADRYHVAPAELALWCTPMRAPLLSATGGTIEFDRNRCSEIHAGELVRLRAISADGQWWNVRTAYHEGWLDHPELGPALPPDRVRDWLAPARSLVVTAATHQTAGLPPLRMGTTLPVLGAEGQWRVPWPSRDGNALVPVSTGEGVTLGHLPFTRRHLFGLALARFGAPYGWGGYHQGLDCSRLLLDLFAVFGIGLPRNSANQALAGDPSVDLHGMTTQAKLEAIRRASRCGVVLLQMPGHIVLYLGDTTDRPDGSGSWVLSSIAEIRRPCDGGGETVQRLNRVVVSNLAVGLGTTKRSFLERLDRMAVFGSCPTATP